MIGAIGAGIGGVTNVLGGLFGKKGKAKESRVQLDDYTTGWSDFHRQFPEVGKAQESFEKQADINNKNFQRRITETSSGLMPALEQASKTALSLTKGEIPQDVADAISENATRLSILGGGGDVANTGAGGLSRLFGTRGSNILGRQLGTTSLDLQQRGFSMLPQVMNLSQGLNPSRYDATQFMFTPQQLLQRRDAVATNNWGVDNRNEARKTNIWDTIANVGSGIGTTLGAVGGLFGEGNSSDGSMWNKNLNVFGDNNQKLGRIPWNTYAPYANSFRFGSEGLVPMATRA